MKINNLVSIYRQSNEETGETQFMLKISLMVDDLLQKKCKLESITYKEELNLDYRTEKDTLGEIKVPAEKFWGAQTQRSKQNFPIGNEKMPKEIIKGFAILKKSAAKANIELGLLEEEKSNAIAHAADKVIAGELNEHFPLVVWQTGSGTQSNMNVNEVLSYVGNEWLKEQNSELVLHPNDDVNKSQSSNDTYPTALHVAAVLKLEDEVLPAVKVL